MTSRSKTLAALAVVITVTISACGSSASKKASAPTPAKKATPAATNTIALAQTSLGYIVVDAQGRTLYQFMKDTPTTSNCKGDCASTWLPLVANGSLTAGDSL